VTFGALKVHMADMPWAVLMMGSVEGMHVG
jgi:hypothetical protein